MALGRYTAHDDSLAQAQDRFWTHTSERDRDVNSGSDLSLDTYAELDSRSALDRYFAEVGTRRASAVASAGTQVGPSLWTLMTPGPTQGVSRPSSDPSLVPPQFKKPKTPPPRTVVATTQTEMYMRHTSQDVMVNSPPLGSRLRRASSSSSSTDSRIPPPPQTSPRSSVQQWLDALDTQAPPPPTPAIPASQPVYVFRCEQFHAAWLLGIPNGTSSGTQFTSQSNVTKVTFQCHFGYSDPGYDGLLYPDVQ